MKPLVIVTRKLPASVELRMNELFNVRLNGDDKVFTKEDLIAAVKEAHVLVTTVTDEISGGVLSKAAPDLKMIANYGVGVDHIDLMSARDKRIIITNTPGVLTEDTADMAMLLILGITRRMSEGEKMLRAGKWKIWSPIGMLGMIKTLVLLVWAVLARRWPYEQKHLDLISITIIVSKLTRILKKAFVRLIGRALIK